MKEIKVKPGEFVRDKMDKEEFEEMKKLLEEFYKKKESEQLETKKTHNNTTKGYKF